VTQKYIAHFSHGVPSAVAAFLAVKEFGLQNVRVVTCDTGSEHSDNERFAKEVEAWAGFKIDYLKSEKYEDVDDVIEKTRWIAGIGGARCTGELKKIPAQKIITWGKGQEIEILGYTLEEQDRVNKWIANNSERKIDPILVRNGLTKEDCQGIISRAGIKRPEMYNLGYRNNNCIGCVKGGIGYWNKIRVDFPDVFARRAKQERDIGATINKIRTAKKKNGLPVWPTWVFSLTNYSALNKDGVEQWKTGAIRMYLDEMPDDIGHYPSEIEVQCGIICMLVDV